MVSRIGKMPIENHKTLLNHSNESPSHNKSPYQNRETSELSNPYKSDNNSLATLKQVPES